MLFTDIFRHWDKKRDCQSQNKVMTRFSGDQNYLNNNGDKIYISKFSLLIKCEYISKKKQLYIEIKLQLL